MTNLDPFTGLRFQRGVEHLHLLGPRATAEFLAEIAGKIGGMSAIVGLLAQYERRLTPEILRTTRGDRFPPRTPLVVPR